MIDLAYAVFAWVFMLSAFLIMTVSIIAWAKMIDERKGRK